MLPLVHRVCNYISIVASGALGICLWNNTTNHFGKGKYAIAAMALQYALAFFVADYFIVNAIEYKIQLIEH